MSHHRLRRATAALLASGLTVAGLTVTAPPASAAPASAAPASTGKAAAAKTPAAKTPLAKTTNAATEPTAAESDRGKLMVVLDSSGSMAEPAGGGQTRIEAARQALNATVDGLPEQAQVGMRVYGATVESKAKEPTKACQDSQAVVPIGTDNRAQLRKEIGAYKPFGETPTAYALRQAAKDLGSEGRRSIVLVSDGEENCHPDPCQVSADLAKQGIDLKIDVVGFNVNDKARKQLQCIADKGNGSYYDAKDADDLTAGLDKLSSRAFRPFEFTGKPVELAEGSTGAPELRAGQYLTTLAAGGQDRYAVVRKKPGSSLWASVTSKAPNDGKLKDNVVYLELSTFDGEQCVGGSDSTYDLSDQSNVFSSTLLLDPHSDSEWGTNGCGAADRLLLRIRNGYDFDADSNAERGELRSELVLVEEPSVPGAEQQRLPGQDEGFAERADDYKPSWTPGSTATETVGGTSFSDAKTLVPGTYADTILPGESLTYRVPLRHGQRAEFVTRFATLGQAEQEALPTLGLDVELDAFGPTRGQLTNDTANVTGKSNEVAGLITPEVRYLNRGDRRDSLRGASVAGYYYFTVQARNRGDAVMVPFELDVRVDGEPRPMPAYAGKATPKGPAGGEGDQGAGAPEKEEKTAKPAKQAADEESGEGLSLASAALPAGIGLVLLAGIVTAILLLRRPRAGRS